MVFQPHSNSAIHTRKTNVASHLSQEQAAGHRGTTTAVFLGWCIGQICFVVYHTNWSRYIAGYILVTDREINKGIEVYLSFSNPGSLPSIFIVFVEFKIPILDSRSLGASSSNLTTITNPVLPFEPWSEMLVPPMRSPSVSAYPVSRRVVGHRRLAQAQSSTWVLLTISKVR